MLGLVDVEASVSGGGSSGQAGAIRYALAMCLRSFVEKSVIDDMKISGLLTQVGNLIFFGTVQVPSVPHTFRNKQLCDI